MDNIPSRYGLGIPCFLLTLLGKSVFVAVLEGGRLAIKGDYVLQHSLHMEVGPFL